MYSLLISSQATGNEPVTLDELKAHLRITTTAEDTLLSAYIIAARQAAENYTNRTLLNTEYKLTLNSLYSSHIPLPMSCPMSTVAADVSITYRKTTGDSTTVPSTVYTPEHQSDSRAFIRLNYNSEWPTDVQDSEGAVQITYRAGYSSVTPTTVCPESVKHWIKMRAGQMFEYREPLLTGTIISNLKSEFVDGLLDRYVVIDI